MMLKLNTLDGGRGWDRTSDPYDVNVAGSVDRAGNKGLVQRTIGRFRLMLPRRSRSTGSPDQSTLRYLARISPPPDWPLRLLSYAHGFIVAVLLAGVLFVLFGGMVRAGEIMTNDGRWIVTDQLKGDDHVHYHRRNKRKTIWPIQDGTSGSQMGSKATRLQVVHNTTHGTVGRRRRRHSHTDESCLPAKLKDMLAQVRSIAPIVVISARAGRPNKSYHPECRAVDFNVKKNYRAVLAYLRSNHSGGLGTYSGRMHHIHIDNGPRYRWHTVVRWPVSYAEARNVNR